MFVQQPDDKVGVIEKFSLVDKILVDKILGYLHLLLQLVNFS